MVVVVEVVALPVVVPPFNKPLPSPSPEISVLLPPQAQAAVVMRASKSKSCVEEIVPPYESRNNKPKNAMVTESFINSPMPLSA